MTLVVVLLWPVSCSAILTSKSQDNTIVSVSSEQVLIMNATYRYKLNKQNFVAVEGLYTGQFIYCGKTADLKVGNVMALGSMPEGILVVLSLLLLFFVVVSSSSS